MRIDLVTYLADDKCTLNLLSKHATIISSGVPVTEAFEEVFKSFVAALSEGWRKSKDYLKELQSAECLAYKRFWDSIDRCEYPEVKLTDLARYTNSRLRRLLTVLVTYCVRC